MIAMCTIKKTIMTINHNSIRNKIRGSIYSETRGSVSSEIRGSGYFETRGSVTPKSPLLPWIGLIGGIKN